MVAFTARRGTPELVAPARRTPHETKALSDVDDQQALRYYQTFVEFFRLSRPAAAAQRAPPGDAAKAIKKALAEALVHFYPIAGRLRELPDDGKLVVDCTAEGVVFVEADADVRLEELGKPLVPPYPCEEELLCDAVDTTDILGKPLFFLQVTRLKCGGFIIGFHICHSIADGFGMIQFVRAIADLARGEALPSPLPVWERELLMARVPIPRGTHSSPAFEALSSSLPLPGDSSDDKDTMMSTPRQGMATHYFFFGAGEIAALRSHVPAHLAQSTSTFELLTAVTWRCRTLALGYAASQVVRLVFTLNARGRWKGSQLKLPVPRGYFGNALFYAVVDASAGELCGGALDHALELVHRAKIGVTEEYMRSMVDAMALLRGQPKRMDRTYVVSDVRWIGEDALDFGWAERVGGGIPEAGDAMSIEVCDFMRCRNADGEDATVVRMYLPRSAMGSFAKEIARLLNTDEEIHHTSQLSFRCSAAII